MYDRNVIELYAYRLYRAATRYVVASMLGGVVAALVLTRIVDVKLQAELEFGYFVAFVLGGIAGYLVGDYLALALRVKAQLALCQVEQEKHLATLVTQAHAKPLPVAAPANTNAA